METKSIKYLGPLGSVILSGGLELPRGQVVEGVPAEVVDDLTSTRPEEFEEPGAAKPSRKRRGGED